MSFSKGPSASEMARAQEEARLREEARLAEQQRIADANTLQKTLDEKTRQANAEAGIQAKARATKTANVLATNGSDTTTTKKSLLSNYSGSI